MTQGANETKSSRGDILYIILLALVLVGASFLLQAKIDFDLTDEGFLWCAATSTAQGEVPILDFRSYDPGRYYWTAGWSFLFGDGILALRLSAALFQVIGLAFGLLAVSRLVANRLILIPIGVMLAAWMFTRHKVFEPSIIMAAVYFGLRMIEDTSRRQHFIAGIFVGLAAFMGRNHGLYNFLAFFFLIVFMKARIADYPFGKRLGIWMAGIIVGCVPYLIMFIFIPGFFSAYEDSVVLMFTQHTTVVPKTIPWPWAADYANLSFAGGIKRFTLGISYLILPLFYILAIIGAMFSKRPDFRSKALLIACGIVGIFYMHHACVRSDVGHLAQSILPFILGMLALPYSFGLNKKWVVACFVATIVILTLVLAIPNNPYIQKLTSKGADNRFVQYNIAGDDLWIRTRHARYIEKVRRIDEMYVPPDEGFLIAPYTPGFYPILGRKPAVWNTYMLWPEEQGRQRKMIEDMKDNNVNWALIADSALDGREELRFRNTHKDVWDYLMAEFEIVEHQGLPRRHLLMHRKAADGDGMKE